MFALRISIVRAAVTIGSLALSACFSPSPPVDGGAESSSSSTPGGACVPGETQTCLCVGNQDGVQSCNPDGSGFTACECTGATTMAATTTGGPPTTGQDTTEGMTTTPEPTTDSPETDTEGEVGSDTEPPGPTGMMGDPYLPCLVDPDACGVEGEVCLFSGGGEELTVCALMGCRTDEDCPIPPPGAGAMASCIDATGDMIPECLLLCTNDNDCAPGMQCFDGLACMWPPGP